MARNRCGKRTLLFTWGRHLPGRRPATFLPSSTARIFGSQKIFRENQIHSSSSSVVDSAGELSLQDNRYTTCGSYGAAWILGTHTYGSFDEFRAATGQEQGSVWKVDVDETACFGLKRSHAENDSSSKTAKRPATPSGWTVVSEIPASIDAQRLLDAASAGQLTVLKNLYTQFRASGLRMTIALVIKNAPSSASLQNAIRDLDMGDIKVSKPSGNDMLIRPTTRFVAPDGSIASEWQDFVGPAEIGLAIRSILGQPLYSEMASGVQ